MKPERVRATRAIRARFESMIAKTWDEYFDQQDRPNLWLSTWEVALMLRDGLRIQLREAMQLVEEVFPELMADYWEQRREAA